MRQTAGLSIRTRIFLGCLCMTLVTLLVGVMSRQAQLQLGQAARGIYDDAFVPMSNIRSAQATLLNLSANFQPGETAEIVADQLQSTLDALDMARERAMSGPGERCAHRLIDHVSRLRAEALNKAIIPDHDELVALENEIDVAVQIYAHDALTIRKSMEAIVDRTNAETIEALIGSLVFAVLITLALTRAIVPPIRYAVGVATAIAQGKLDSEIAHRGSVETTNLLSALAIMQASIADKIEHIERLMRQQASSHASEIEAQNTRFETALNHITLGLCMFDAEGRLLVQNRKFDELFVSLNPHEDPLDRLRALKLDIAAKPEDVAPWRLLRTLDDGRAISIAAEGMAGGGLVVTYEDVTERENAAERLSHLASHDMLTGLANRTRLRDELETRLDPSSPPGSLAVVCLDLDRFKSVNDTLGHAVGDGLLQQVAKRLVALARRDDVVVRLGGDEFAIVQNAAHQPAAAIDLATRAIAALRQPFDVEGHNVMIGVSIGVAHTSDRATSPDGLLRDADTAMYHAKSDGRGTYRLFEPEMAMFTQARRLLEADLRNAVAASDFELHYQPIVNAGSAKLVGYEALLRWRHPRRGLVPPDEFIPIVEEIGLIHVIGPWVLEQACREAATWPPGLRVAVNLSALQFRKPGLPADVEAALRKANLPASRLELEITESVLLQNDETTLDILRQLRARGVRIAMDDFGTGFSSLRYLCQFPFDTIKIDRSFIASMHQGDHGFAIVTSAINLARTLRMDVIAEGVETITQMALLRDAGCNEMQGYLFGRPRPSGDLVECLTSDDAIACPMAAVA